MKFYFKVSSVMLNLILLIFFSGCVSGPKDPGRTFADKMNGENYESSNVVMGVPVLDRKPVHRKISGHVFCGEGLSQTRANHATVSLMKENQTVGTATTDTTGLYVLSAQMDPSAVYQLSAKSNCGASTRTLPKGSEAKTAEEDFYLQK